MNTWKIKLGLLIVLLPIGLLMRYWLYEKGVAWWLLD